MKKALLISLLVTFVSACTYNSIDYQGKTYQFNTAYKSKAEALKKAQEMAEIEKVEAEKAAKEKAEKEKLEAKSKFEKALSEELNGQCQSDKWTCYKIAHSFYTNSKKFKLTPFKMMWGSAYEMRHIEIDTAELKELSREIGIALIKDCNSSDISYGYYSLLPSLSEEQEKVFNSIVSKYETCYQKLK